MTQEALLLKKKAELIKTAVDKRNVVLFSSKKKTFEKSTGVFFKSCFAQMFVSKKMEFILQCYLLAVTRQPYKTLENGIVLTRTEMSLLAKLSKRIALLDKIARRKIVEMGQKKLSALSVAFLRERAKSVSLFEEKEKEHLELMLSEKMTRVWTPNSKYEPKTFGCLFYEYKALLALLREKKALIAFKSIVTEGKPFFLLFQPKEEKENFICVRDEAYSSFMESTPVVVFEGVTLLKREEFGEWATKLGFSRVILACGAIEAPYERTSELSDVKNKEAQEEILLYRKLYKEEVETHLLLDHVYCNLLQKEQEILK